MKGGWAKDTTSATQAERGRKAAKKSGWAKKPMCSTMKALASFNAYRAKGPKGKA